MPGRKSSTKSSRRSSSAEPEVRSCAVVPGTSLSTADDGGIPTHGDHLTQHFSAPEVQLTPDDMKRDFVANTKIVPADVSDEEELEAVLCSIRLARQQQQRRRMSEVASSSLLSTGTGIVEPGALRFEFYLRF